MSARALAERALAAAGPGDGHLASVVRERSLTLRFAGSRATQATAVDDVGVQLATICDGQVGRATTNGTSDEQLAECAARARRAARIAAEAGGTGPYPGFPAIATARAHGGYDAETATLDPATGGGALAAAFAAAEAAGVAAHGIWSAGEVQHAVATGGAAAEDRVTDVFMKVICTAPGGRSGYAAGTASAAGALDPAAIGERAAATAAFDGDAAVLPPGEYTVVLEPHALGLLLELLAEPAFDGLAHHEGRGALTDKLGTRVVAPSINLSDSPRYPQTLPRAFDAEGVPKAPLPLIQDGIAHRVVHDTRSAALAGAVSTGHAQAVAGGRPPLPTNLVLLGGGVADERELCRGVERGVYVTRLWYGNVVRPRESLTTAVTRDGTFLIEDGRISRPLADMRVTDSVLGMLARTEALAAQPILTSEGEFYGRRFASGTVCPAIRVGGVRFTGPAGPGPST